jgi:nucleoside-diphosphate-sugar epimerase
MLMIGGTGIIGKSMIELVKNYELVVIGKENVKKLETLKTQHWDLIYGIYNFEDNHSKKLHDMFKDSCDHFIILSTTLVYDRSNLTYERIPSSHPLTPKNTQGAYVDKKLQLEEFWEATKCTNWTILRPYHILGPNSNLGCLPPHNRNPNLVEEIKKGEIELCEGGRMPLNIVHPEDINRTVLKSAGNSETFGKKYNVVNPVEVIARDYFLKIAEFLKTPLRIKNKPAEECWEEREWELTTLPHLYDTSDLEKDTGYTPDTPLETCIQDSLDNPPKPEIKEETQVHKRMNIKPNPKRNSYYL